MTQAFRSNLKSLVDHGQFSNVGLGLDRYLTRHATDDDKRQTNRPEVSLLEAACNSQAPEPYRAAYCQWVSHCDHLKVLQFSATLCSSLAIGIGRSSPLEVGINLHHTYGMPMIPGSAIKGVCRIAAKTQKIDISQVAGALVFWDAWYNPESMAGKPFHRDVITVHHPKYYGSNGSDWPTDFDDPVPVNFLVVKPGAQFHFAVSCASESWKAFAFDALTYSLTHLGLGAKTNAGYGRFEEITIRRPPPVPERMVWRNIVVTRKPSPMEFTFTSPEGRLLRVRSTRAEQINGALALDFRARLKKNNRFSADVTVTITGDTVEIDAIVPAQNATAN